MMTIRSQAEMENESKWRNNDNETSISIILVGALVCSIKNLTFFQMLMMICAWVMPVSSSSAEGENAIISFALL